MGMGDVSRVLALKFIHINLQVEFTGHYRRYFMPGDPSAYASLKPVPRLCAPEGTVAEGLMVTDGSSPALVTFITLWERWTF